MRSQIVFLIILLSIVAFFIIFGFAYKSKKLWPKVVFLAFATMLVSIAGFFGISMANIYAANVNAAVISVQYIDEYSCKIECEYTYKNKIYRAFIERYYYEAPEIGSTIGVRVTINKPDEINIYRGDESGDGLALFFLTIGMLVFGCPGVILLILSAVSISKYYKNISQA